MIAISEVAQTGLGNYQALRAATVEPAKIMGVSNQLGTIQPGMIADMDVIHGNPLREHRDDRQRCVCDAERASVHPAAVDRAIRGEQRRGCLRRQAGISGGAHTEPPCGRRLASCARSVTLDLSQLC